MRMAWGGSGAVTLVAAAAIAHASAAPADVDRHYDGSKVSLPAVAKRGPSAPNPYVVGADSVRRYLTVANECAQAALATLP